MSEIVKAIIAQPVSGFVQPKTLTVTVQEDKDMVTIDSDYHRAGHPVVIDRERARELGRALAAI